MNNLIQTCSMYFIITQSGTFLGYIVAYKLVVFQSTTSVDFCSERKLMQKQMMKQVLLLFCFASSLTLSVSESKSDSLQRSPDSFSFGYIQVLSFKKIFFFFLFLFVHEHTFCVKQTKTPVNCSYLVIISTSCSSPKFTWEKIGISFGDAYGNKVLLHIFHSINLKFCSFLSFSSKGSRSSLGRNTDKCIVYRRIRSKPLTFN